MPGMTEMSEEIARKRSFPLIELKIDWKVRGVVAIPGGNVLQLNRGENWSKAKFFIFDVYEVDMDGRHKIGELPLSVN